MAPKNVPCGIQLEVHDIVLKLRQYRNQAHKYFFLLQNKHYISVNLFILILRD